MLRFETLVVYRVMNQIMSLLTMTLRTKYATNEYIFLYKGWGMRAIGMICTGKMATYKYRE